MKLPAIFLTALLLCPVASAENLYLAEGVAASDREWRGEDYSKFNTLLTNQKIPLPLLNHEDQANLIKRICNTENLRFGQNKSVPLSLRMNDFLQINETISKLISLYINKALAGEKVGGEVSLLMGFLLHLSAVGIQLADEFAPLIDPGDEARMAGLKQMKSGMTTCFLGAYNSVANDNIYTEDQRSHLLEQIAATAAPFSTLLPPKTRVELTGNFNRLSKRLNGSRDKKSIDTILEKLESKEPAS